MTIDAGSGTEKPWRCSALAAGPVKVVAAPAEEIAEVINGAGPRVVGISYQPLYRRVEVPVDVACAHTGEDISFEGAPEGLYTVSGGREPERKGRR